MSVNRVFLVGNLGKDAECRTPGSGDRMVINFTIATSERYRAQTGEIKEDTTWHNIVYWTKADSTFANYLKKGTQVFVEGSINNRQYTDQSGATKYVTEIKASRVDLIGSRPQGAGINQPGPYQANGVPAGNYRPQQYGQPQDAPHGFQQTGLFPNQPVNQAPLYGQTQQAPARPQMPAEFENLPDGF